MGVVVNQGLIQLWRAALNATPPATQSPRVANLIAGPFVEAATLTYASLTWAAGTHALNVQSLWNIGIPAGANYVSALAPCVFTLTPGDAGLVFYGAGLYDPNALILFDADAFPVPYVVPTGGATLTWTFNLTFGGCPEVP